MRNSIFSFPSSENVEQTKARVQKQLHVALVKYCNIEQVKLNNVGILSLYGTHPGGRLIDSHV